MSEIPEAAREAIGRTIAAEDVVTAAPVVGFWATFGRGGAPPVDGDPLPPLWHGLYCTAKLPPGRLGPDGLAADEALLPSLPDFPSKLFGGARFTFERAILIGQTIRRESSIAGFESKTGKTGGFLIARVEHRIIGPDGLAVIEENDVIFRPSPAPDGATSSGGPPPSEAAAEGAWRQTIDPDPALMFRHSALTFNSHRIHYDRDYARAHGYPGLLVQGTLIARLMLELLYAERPAAAVTAFAFRSGRPLHDTGPFTIEGTPSEDGSTVAFRALDHDRALAMSASATVK